MTGATRGVLSTGLAFGLLSAIGPLAIDLYLPAFPAMAHDLHASPGEVQRTLSVFLLALAAAQIPVGSFGDRFGRKLPLYIGLGLFVAASIACAFASSVHALVALRLVEGFGVCAGTAVSRAMIRDLHQGHQAARLMAISFLIIGVSPVLAPAAGNFLLAVVSWRGLFLVLAVLGVGGLVVAAFLPETLPPARRNPGAAADPARLPRPDRQLPLHGRGDDRGPRHHHSLRLRDRGAVRLYRRLRPSRQDLHLVARRERGLLDRTDPGLAWLDAQAGARGG